MEKEEGKKAVIRKMGMEPIQRKGMQYEFDIVCSLGMDNQMSVEKTRCSSLKDQAYRPGSERAFTEVVQAWLDGIPAPEPVRVKPSEVDDLKAHVGRIFGFKPEDFEVRWRAYIVHVLNRPVSDPDLTQDDVTRLRAFADSKAAVAAK